METDKRTYFEMLPKRRPDSNKGTYGRILIAAGSEGMCGAAVLSGLAAYRCGGGLVRILTHQENRIIVQSLLPEAVFSGYDDDTDLPSLADANASWADIFVLGPGLDTGERSTELMRQLLHSLRTHVHMERFPFLLIDADGLNLLSLHPELMEQVDGLSQHMPVAVTPHPMEMSRLLHCTLSEILKAPRQAAERFMRQHGCITLLKGPETLVLAPQGQSFQNTEPSPALSKGGAGDVLSGAIAGIYAVLRAERLENLQRTASAELPDRPPFDRTAGRSEASQPSPAVRKLSFDSTVLAMLLHAEAGRRAADIHGTHGVLMREVADLLGNVMEG